MLKFVTLTDLDGDPLVVAVSAILSLSIASEGHTVVTLNVYEATWLNRHGVRESPTEILRQITS